MVTMMKMATNVMALQMEAAHKEDMVGWSPKNQQQMQLGGWVEANEEWWRTVKKRPLLLIVRLILSTGEFWGFFSPLPKNFDA